MLKAFARENGRQNKRLNLYLKGYKKLWEMEKMLATGIFSFSNNVLEKTILHGF